MSKPLELFEPGTLRPTSQVFNTALQRLNAAEGVVHVADLEWPLFDPEREMTMVEYVGEVGATMASSPRERLTKDSALQVFGRDFDQAKPESLPADLYFPKQKEPKKSVAKIMVTGYGLREENYPGILPFDTGIAVSEEVYEELVMNGKAFVNRIYNRTLRKRRERQENLPADKIGEQETLEESIDISIESAVYALADKYLILEARNQHLLKRDSILRAIHKSIERGSRHRIGSMEPYRMESLVAIIEMVRVACQLRNYGTNQTRATLNAAVSNLHRAPKDAPKDILTSLWLVYTSMARRYNKEVRSKVNQSIDVCFQEIADHRQHIINAEDRTYRDH